MHNGDVSARLLRILLTGILVMMGGLVGSATADETCQSPFLPKVTGQEDYIYVWTLGIKGVADGNDSIVTVGPYLSLTSEFLPESGWELPHLVLTPAAQYPLAKSFETLFSGSGSSLRRVGLVEFPSPGMWSIVLISQAPSVEIANKLPGADEHISVFLPCAPNPTTGFFFYVRKSEIIEIDMSAEDAATLIMSAGVVQPGSDPQKKIAALAATAQAARVANSAVLKPAKVEVE